MNQKTPFENHISIQKNFSFYSLSRDSQSDSRFTIKLNFTISYSQKREGKVEV